MEEVKKLRAKEGWLHFLEHASVAIGTITLFATAILLGEILMNFKENVFLIPWAFFSITVSLACVCVTGIVSRKRDHLNKKIKEMEGEDED